LKEYVLLLALFITEVIQILDHFVSVVAQLSNFSQIFYHSVSVVAQPSSFAENFIFQAWYAMTFPLKQTAV
jgi:hypothetical protein